jgi:hypothetical protein
MTKWKAKLQKKRSQASSCGCLLIIVLVGLIYALVRVPTPRAQMGADVPTMMTLPSETSPGFIASPTLTITNTVQPTVTHTPPPTVPPATLAFADYERVLASELERYQPDTRDLSVRVSDGRANGGERVITIAYIVGSIDADRMRTEIHQIFLSTGVIVLNEGLDVDSVALILGEPTTRAGLGAFVASAADVRLFINGELTTEEFEDRITATSF